MALFTGAAILSVISSVFTGGFSKAADTVRDIKIANIKQQGDKITVAGNLELARLENEKIRSKNAKDIRIAIKDHWEIRVASGLSAISTSFHFAAINIDKTYNMGWNVQPLPEPLNEWQGSIILGLFGLGIASKGINVLAAKLLK